MKTNHRVNACIDVFLISPFEDVSLLHFLNEFSNQVLIQIFMTIHGSIEEIERDCKNEFEPELIPDS